VIWEKNFISELLRVNSKFLGERNSFTREYFVSEHKVSWETVKDDLTVFHSHFAFFNV